MRCRFVIHDKDVIAITSYAGKVVKATAHCSDSDTFDLEIGKKLAEKKLDLKVAKKRLKRAENQYQLIRTNMIKLMAASTAATQYLTNAESELYAAEAALTEFTNSLA